ncbi:MAG: PAS domain S-box protein [Deltaproteobacteria bacterium]
MEQNDPRLVASFKHASRYLGFGVLFLGFLVIAGWAFDITLLKRIFPGLNPMTPLTAANFVLMGASVYLLAAFEGRRPASNAASVLALTVWFTSFLTVLEYCLNISLGIDRLIFPSKLGEIKVFPGRMSPNATFCFLLASASVLLFSLYKKRTVSAYAYIFLQGTIALLGLIGYAYGIESLYGISLYKPMAFHTAVGLLMLFFALVFLRPDAGPLKIGVSRSEGGLSLRRLLPLVIAVPFLLGVAVIVGYRWHFYGIAFGLSILIVLIIVVFSGVVWKNSLALHRTDLLRAEAEKKAELEKEFTAELLKNTTTPTFVIDNSHRVIVWNRACEKLTGVGAGEVLGTTDHWKAFYNERRPCLADILLDGECARLCKYYTMYARSPILPEGWHTEGWYSLSGQRRYIVFDAAPVCSKDGDLIAVIETLQDITARVMAEESLHESEERYRELIQNLPVGLFRSTTGKEGRFIMANPAMARMFKYDSVLDLVDVNIERLFGDEKQGDDVVRRLKEEGNIIGEEILFRRSDGSSFWGAVTARIVRSAAGMAMFYDGMIEDVTERRRIEEMKSDFVSLVSHQLKTPVAEIKGYIFNLLSGITGEINPKQRQYLEDMQDISEKNYKLISDLLNVSRIERGVIEVALQPVDLKLVVDTVLNEYYPAVKGKGLDLSVEGLDDGINVLADREKFQEALINVINNALKFTESGTISLKVRSDGTYGILEVEDTGPGMPPETLDRLFRKDVALSGAPKAGGSAGLGLYIGKNFMLLQNGDVLVESTVGKGTKFTFKIPLA